MRIGRAKRIICLVSALLVLWAFSASQILAGETAVMEVSPNHPFVWASSGSPGGPFSPSSVTYAVTNRGTAESLSWSAGKSQPWVTLSSEGGILAPGRSATVTVSIDEAVAQNCRPMVIPIPSSLPTLPTTPSSS